MRILNLIFHMDVSVNLKYMNVSLVSIVLLEIYVLVQKAIKTE